MKTAVVLFNLGGPLDEKGIYPFLKSLFSDPAILNLPNPFRHWLATAIAWKRTPKAREIFERLGGKSPLLTNTRRQAEHLGTALGKNYKIFVVLRHAPPFVDEVLQEIQHYRPHEIVLLPLYPQFSTTTTGSSFRQWQEKTRSLRFVKKTKIICCYPTLPGFIKAFVDLIQRELALFQKPPRLLFLAHGLPEKIVKRGDPYVDHVEKTAHAILKELPLKISDWQICYQSRVGPLPWTKPDLNEEITRAAADQKGVLIIPLSFVSEHSETLVELDITYQERAQERGICEYRRVPTVSVHPLFIEGLADLVREGGREKMCVKGTSCCLFQDLALD